MKREEGDDEMRDEKGMKYKMIKIQLNSTIFHFLSLSFFSYHKLYLFQLKLK